MDRLKERRSSRDKPKGVEIVEQEKMNAPPLWSKSGVKRENFSPMEKRIAKVGLCVVVPAAMFYALHLLLPDAREVAVMFANAGMFLLLLAASCVLLKPAEAAVNGAKKAAGFGAQFIKRRRMAGKPVFLRAGAAVRQGGLSRRTRIRSRAYRSHRTRSLSTNASGGSSDSSGDSSDPPEPPLPHNAVRKPHTPPSPWRRPYVPGCWRLPFGGIRR